MRGGQGLQQMDLPYPGIHHLLPTSITIPMVEAASAELVDALVDSLPSAVILLAGNSSATGEETEPKAESVAAAKASLSLDEKRHLLKKVLRSPQFHQSLGSLTMALRDGGLPGIADALGVKVENGGYLPEGRMPMGGGAAIRAFVDGIVEGALEEEQEKKDEGK